VAARFRSPSESGLTAKIGAYIGGLLLQGAFSRRLLFFFGYGLISGACWRCSGYDEKGPHDQDQADGDHHQRIEQDVQPSVASGLDPARFIFESATGFHVESLHRRRIQENMNDLANAMQCNDMAFGVCGGHLVFIMMSTSACLEP
jgi:hypothetical protein